MIRWIKEIFIMNVRKKVTIYWNETQSESFESHGAFELSLTVFNRLNPSWTYITYAVQINQEWETVVTLYRQ